MRAAVNLLAGHEQGIAAKIGCGSFRAPNRERQSALKSGNPVDAPPSDDLVHRARCRRTIPPTASEGQLIAPAVMEDIRRVVSAVPVVTLNSKAGKIRSAIAFGVANTEKVTVIAAAL